MQQRNLSITSIQTVDYNVTNAYANVTGYVITVPEDGWYDIKALYTIYNTAVGRQTSTRLAVNGNLINGINVISVPQVNANTYTPCTLATDNIQLKSGDVVSLQAAYSIGATTISGTTANVYGSLQVIKRGL